MKGKIEMPDERNEKSNGKKTKKQKWASTEQQMRNKNSRVWEENGIPNEANEKVLLVRKRGNWSEHKTKQESNLIGKTRKAKLNFNQNKYKSI